MILIVTEEELKKFEDSVWFQKGYEKATIFATITKDSGIKVVKNKFGMRGKSTLSDFYRNLGIVIKKLKENL